jgi:hypothetical protein
MSGVEHCFPEAERERPPRRHEKVVSDGYFSSLCVRIAVSSAGFALPFVTFIA